MRHHFALPLLVFLGAIACGRMSVEQAEQQCGAKRGIWFVNERERTETHDAQGVCIERSNDGGRRCTSSHACGIACICDPNVEDGATTVGVCAEYPPLPGSGWHCTIDEKGIAHQRGMLVGQTRAPNVTR